jgi:tetratricopeptide (TPR) repeat protein
MDLGLTRWRQEKPDRKAALAALAQCVRLKPEEPRPYYLRGSILMELKDYTAAAQELTTAKRLDEKNPRVLLALGITYRELANDSSALQEFRAADKLEIKDEALKLDIRNSLAYVLADLGREAEATEAVKLAGEVVAAKSGVVAYLDTLGWAQARAGKLKEAAKTLEEAAGKAANGNAEVFYHLGYAYAGLKKHAEAISALDKARMRLAQAKGKHPRAVRLETSVKTLLSQEKSEKSRIDAERRRQLGAMGDPDTQRATPKAGQAPGKRPEPKKTEVQPEAKKKETK